MKLFSALLCLFFLNACGYRYHDSISGSGNVMQKTMLEDTVKAIEISEKLNAVIILSDSNKVVLKADDNLFDIVNFDFNNGSLKITSEKYIRMARTCEVIIYSNSIRSIQASRKSTVKSKGELNIEKLHLSLSSAARISVKGNFSELIVDCSSGSDLDLEGSTKQISISASSAADVNAFELAANDANVNASSASDVRLTVQNHGVFSASSAADIKYRGKPLHVDIQKGSLGSVIQAKD